MDSDLANEIGRLLRNRRERVRWTQDRLAREAGTSQQCLSRIERGGQAAGLDTLERLFAVLGWELRFDLAVRDDSQEDEVGEVDDAARVAVMGHFEWYLSKSRGAPYLIDGELGALLHGVPLDQIVATDPSVARVLDRVHEARARIRK